MQDTCPDKQVKCWGNCKVSNAAGA